MKNKIFRKVIAGVMSLGILLSMVPMAVTAAYDYTETVDKVTALNVVPEKIDANAIVTRKDLAKFVYYMLNVAENGAVYKDDSFYDIDMTSEYHEYISAIAGYGLMVGVEEGVFAPDMNATFGMAVKVLIDATGYYPLAREGDLAAYARVASERGMLKNVTYIPNQAITMGELSQLIWNALQMRAVETTISGNSTQVVTDVDLLWHYHKIALSEGMVRQNAYTGYNDAAGLEKGYVKVDYTVYKVGADNVEDMIGKNIDFYYKVDDDFDKPVVLWAKAKDCNSVVFDNKDDITAEGTSNGKITYKNKSRQKAYDLSSTPNMIYNGKYKEYNVDDVNNLLVGTVELVDANLDRKYELVVVKSYIPYIVLGRDADDRKLYDKGSKPTVSIAKNASVKVTKDGVGADFVNLAVDDVVLVASDKYTIVDGEKLVDSANSTVYDLIVSSNAIVGTVGEVNTDEKIAVINDEVYDISATFDGAGNTPVTLGEKATFYIDSFGNIVYVVKGEALSGSKGRRVDGKIGFVTKYGDPMTSREEKITARIFDENGKWATYDFAEKVRIDGDVYKTPQSMYAYLTAGDIVGRVTSSQLAGYLITYRLNEEGKIKFIDTGKLNDTKEERSQSMDQKLPWTSAGYPNYKHIVNEQCILSNSTLILSVPVLSDGVKLLISAEDEASYKWVKRTSFEVNNNYYQYQIWNVGDNDVAEVAVYYNTAVGEVTLDRTYPCEIVTKIIDTVNEDNEPIRRLTLMGSAGTKVIDVVDSTLVKKWNPESANGSSVASSVNALRLGDVVAYNMGVSGVTNMEIRFSIENSMGEMTPYSEAIFDGKTSGRHGLFGNLYRMEGEVIQVLFGNDPTNLSVRKPYVNDSSNITIICYDLDANTFEAVAGDSLKDYVKTRDINQTDKIYIRRNWGNIEAIFIYRNVQ